MAIKSLSTLNNPHVKHIKLQAAVFGKYIYIYIYAIEQVVNTAVNKWLVKKVKQLAISDRI